MTTQTPGTPQGTPQEDKPMNATTWDEQRRAWDDYHRAVAGIAAELVGAAAYLREHPEHGTEARQAAVLQEYAARIEALEMPR